MDRLSKHDFATHRKQNCDEFLDRTTTMKIGVSDAGSGTPDG
jgi:hypothetical protein